MISGCRAFTDPFPINGELMTSQCLEHAGDTACSQCVESWMECDQCESISCCGISCVGDKCIDLCLACLSEEKRRDVAEGRGCESCGAIACGQGLCDQATRHCSSCDVVLCPVCYEFDNHDDHDSEII